LYAFSILAIFLVLAALYESWSIPISILLALPLGTIGGVLASSWRGLANDVYFQIGLLTVLGLTTKNAILIVQFAKIRVEQGAGLIEATLEGAKLRLRPIVMTSLAFGFGVLPLVIASGAGAGAQMAIGTSVLGGMATATFLAIFFIPLFFVLVTQVFGREEAGETNRSGHFRHRNANGGAAKCVSLFLSWQCPFSCAGVLGHLSTYVPDCRFPLPGRKAPPPGPVRRALRQPPT
jgi:HAE1 family hydrophobic/amphiphilic exporter-1